MAGLTKEVYLEYAKKIVSVLSGDDFFDKYKKRVDDGASEFKLVKKRLIQDISIDWIDIIEDALPNLDAIVRNPRRFIVQEEDIVDVSLAKAISTESIKHLAQHTNMISKIEDDGSVTPNRILNITKEESFEIYENRFIYTLLLKLKDFVSMRYDKIKKASATQDVLQLNVDSKFSLPSKKISYRTEFLAQLSFDEVMRLDPETLDKIERIAKIDRIITDFLASSFAKTMRNSAPVRPPITRTNVILKEPNFKKALTIWQFVETYNVSGGFSTSDDVENYDISKSSQGELCDMITLNTMLFESLYDQHETNMDLEDAEFTDLLSAGEMDFGKDELEHDEFSQKLDEEELEEEAEKEEEAKPPEEEEEAETEGEEEAETPPEPEIEEEEIEKEVDKDKEVEAPPKEEPEDEEPDADEFDQNLFDIRKLYKRPDDDKLKQEEIARVKDAIDRCLVSYRKIKQEELDDRDREYNQRRRSEELAKRAAAFRTHRQELEQQGGQVFLGGNAFTAYAAKIVLPNKDVDFAKEHSDLFVKRGEKLELTDQDLDGIRKSIEEMERLRHKDVPHIAFAGDENGEVDEEENAEPELPVVDLEAQIKDADEKKRMDRIAARHMVAGEGSRNLLGSGAAEGFVDVRENKPERAAAVVPDKPIKPIKPTSTAVKRVRTIQPVDENKVKVGEAPVKRKTAPDALDDTFNEQRAMLGDLSKPNRSRSARKRTKPLTSPTETTPIETKPTETAQVETPIAVVEPVAVQEVKPKIRKSSEPKDPWALSATTLNQRYDTASGINREFAAVDENKVRVGDAPVSGKTASDALDDTFVEQRARLGNLAVPNSSAANANKNASENVVKVKPDKPRTAKAVSSADGDGKEVKGGKGKNGKNDKTDSAEKSDKPED